MFRLDYFCVEKNISFLLSIDDRINVVVFLHLFGAMKVLRSLYETATNALRRLYESATNMLLFKYVSATSEMTACTGCFDNKHINERYVNKFMANCRNTTTI